MRVFFNWGRTWSQVVVALGAEDAGTWPQCLWPHIRQHKVFSRNDCSSYIFICLMNMNQKRSVPCMLARRCCTWTGEVPAEWTRPAGWRRTDVDSCPLRYIWVRCTRFTPQRSLCSAQTLWTLLWDQVEPGANDEQLQWTEIYYNQAAQTSVFIISSAGSSLNWYLIYRNSTVHREETDRTNITLGLS